MEEIRLSSVEKKQEFADLSSAILELRRREKDAYSEVERCKVCIIFRNESCLHEIGLLLSTLIEINALTPLNHAAIFTLLAVTLRQAPPLLSPLGFILASLHPHTSTFNSL